MAPPPDDHDCGWKKYAEAQAAELALLKEKFEALERRVLGKKSDRLKPSKLPPPLPPKSDPEAAAEKRKTNASLRNARLETETIPIPKEACTCPGCGATELRRVGKGKPSTVYDYVQPFFRKRVYLRETLACRCGHIVTANAPDRVGEKTRYAAGFVAHLIVVNKCGDSNPQYRLEKSYRNIGYPDLAQHVVRADSSWRCRAQAAAQRCAQDERRETRGFRLSYAPRRLGSTAPGSAPQRWASWRRAGLGIIGQLELWVSIEAQRSNV